MNYKTLNHDKFKVDFHKIDWATLLSGNDIDVAYDHFLEKVENPISIFPLKKFPKEN